jgi:hypothetical protein
MFTSQRPTTPGNVADEFASKDGDSAVNHYGGRLIQIALTLWLLPALVILLAVGGIGIVALAIGRMFVGPVSQSLETRRLEPVRGEWPTDHGSDTAAPRKPKQQVVGVVADRAPYRKRNHV